MPVMLYLMVGYPGSGKTTAARFISELTGAVHIWADQERNKRFAPPTYSNAENVKLYAALNTEAADLLAQGRSVVFDTNFNFKKDRDKLRAVASKTGAQTVVIWVTTAKDLARERATKQSHGQETRVWGNMPVDRFNHIAGNLQPPGPSEHPIKIEGVDLTKQAIDKVLQSL
ncbi:MAG TPA: ATP-binding protein [Candidatus Saccharimonadales bacterium]|nr:ATP-binding protein [Candidatus Saccharimonadales bacterium]